LKLPQQAKGANLAKKIFATKTHYPGETFTVSAVVVGEELGTVNGTVYAQFLPLQHSETEPSLKDLQESQRVGHDSCTELKYSVLSKLDLEILVLTAQALSVSHYIDSTRANQSTNVYPLNTIVPVCRSKVLDQTFHTLPTQQTFTVK